MSSDRITDQLTEAGRYIERNSFAIVDAEAGEHNYTSDQWGVVRRMIHASADFEFNGLTRFSEDAVATGLEALAGGAPIIADVEMICVGLSRPRLAHFGVTAHHFISDADVIAQAKKENTTRAVQAIRKAHDKKLLDGGIVAVGNAPTALLEVIRLVKEENVRPALLIGMPVGFVSALESKEELCALTQTEWIITHGRKGGSTLVVAAIHALLALAEEAGRNN
jgi:precorrin-8X/cobalt-precorrin-8 methylmutase